jgi:Pyridoxamine 5'-phosphate oxidase
MWFVWDGAYLKFTHATNRQKYQNIRRDPRVAVSITAVDDPYTYAEFRGVVERIEEEYRRCVESSLLCVKFRYRTSSSYTRWRRSMPSTRPACLRALTLCPIQ